MQIKGTSNIRGVLDLSSIKQQLKAGQSLYIRDNDFWHSDIQIAKKMGWITIEGTPPEQRQEEDFDDEEEQQKEERMIKCENIYDRAITMRGHNTEIKPGQIFFLSEGELESPHIRAAMANKMIKIVGDSLIEENEDSEESTVNITNMFEQEKKKELLDTNEELPPITLEKEVKVIKDKKNVIWNEGANVKNIDTSSKVISTEDPKPVDSNEGDPKGSYVVVDPNKARTKYKENKDEVIFVDEVQQKEKVKEHPTMKKEAKTKAMQKDEVDLLTEEKENEKRIKEHPILGKKKEQDELDFIV